MLLIATQDSELAKTWSEGLMAEFTLYEPFVKEYKTLESILKKNPVEVLLLDSAALPQQDINYITPLIEQQPNLKIVLFVNTYHPQEELSAIIFGVKAYCLKSLSTEMIKKIIKKIEEGELWVDRKFSGRLLNALADLTKAKHTEAVYLDRTHNTLTPREKEIANLVATGYPNRKIANALNISERTVKAHLGVIFRKLNISDRLQLALYITKHKQMSGVWSGKSPS